MADSNQVIAASLQFNTDEAVKNALRLKGEVENLRKEFNKAEAGSDAQLAALKKLNAAEADLTAAMAAETEARNARREAQAQADAARDAHPVFRHAQPRRRRRRRAARCGAEGARPARRQAGCGRAVRRQH